VVDGVDGGANVRFVNGRGQYSDAVLNELESQNDQQVDGILGKVRLLKDVSLSPSHTLARTHTPVC
jgi:blocked-early-in-transport protein 1